MEGNTSGWDIGDHTRNRKRSGLKDIDHYNRGQPCHMGYIWGRVIFLRLLGTRLGSGNE